MGKARVNGVEHHFLQVGAGPDLVMVHGLGANLAFWNLRIVPLLSSDYRVTTYDLRGHGYSEMPPDGYSVAELAADLAALLQYLGIERAHLVGHSYGGGVALECALRSRERVASLVLADAVIPPLLGLALGSRTASSRRALLKARLQALGIQLPETTREGAWSLLEGLTDPPVGEQLREQEGAADLFVPFGLWNGASRSAARLRDLVRRTTALEDFLRGAPLSRRGARRLDQRAMALYGEHSRYRPIGRALIRVLPNCRAAVVPGVGHFFPLLRPTAFARGLRRFLARGDGAPPPGRRPHPRPVPREGG